MVRNKIERELADASSEERLGKLWRKSLSGGAFTLGSKVFRLVLTIVTYIVIARELSLDEFGLAALVTPIIAFTMIFSDMGFSMATIQRKIMSDEDASVSFWMSFVTGLLFTAITAFLLGPIFALIYGEPRVVTLTYALSLSVFLFAMRSQYNALMNRELKFNGVALIQLGSHVLASAVGIGAALHGFGAWSLICMRLAQGGFETLGYILTVRWVPKLVSFKKFPIDIFKFGAHLTGYRLVDYGNRNLDNVLIGAVYGAAALAPYTMAYRLMRLPIDEFNGALSRIVTTSLSRLQDDVREFETYYCRLLNLISLIGAPAITFAGIMSDPLIRAAMDNKYEEAAPIFSLLAIASLAQLLYSTVSWVQISTARTDRTFKWSLISSVPILTAFVVGLKWGAVGVAGAYAVAVLILTIPTFLYGLATSPVSGKAVWRAVVPGLITAAAVAAVLGAFILWNRAFAFSFWGLMVAAGLALVTYGCVVPFAIGLDRTRKYAAMALAKLPISSLRAH